MNSTNKKLINSSKFSGKYKLNWSILLASYDSQEYKP